DSAEQYAVAQCENPERPGLAAGLQPAACAPSHVARPHMFTGTYVHAHYRRARLAASLARLPKDAAPGCPYVEACRVIRGHAPCGVARNTLQYGRMRPKAQLSVAAHRNIGLYLESIRL